MELDYTFTEFDEIYCVFFPIKGIKFCATVDKESKKVIDISTVSYGVWNENPYNENTSIWKMTFLDVPCYLYENAVKEIVEKI